jgi:S-adenosylmethionine-diacylgycerolhomoserine-N-methlytransferase
MLFDDTAVLIQLMRGQSRNGTHAERLQAFYAPQAARYDTFRDRLLHGRRELIELLDPMPGDRVVELGGGTGANLDFFGQKRLRQLDRFDLVDICPALLEVAQRRSAQLENVHIIKANVAQFQPQEPVDIVYLSYALTMIPDWERAIENAIAMLRPGGKLGVVDFYVSFADPPPGLARHDTLTRWFWPRWFVHDGVRLSSAHLATLLKRLDVVTLLERRAPVPYLPGLRVPYYVFTGRKR